LRMGPSRGVLLAGADLCGTTGIPPKAPKVPESEVTEVSGRAAVISVPSWQYDSYTIPVQGPTDPGRFRGLPLSPQKPTRHKASHRRPRRAQSLRQNTSRLLNTAQQFGKSRPIGFLQPTGHNTSRKEIPCVAWPGEVSKGRTSGVNGFRVSI
jgi:hypothetical protein